MIKGILFDKDGTLLKFDELWNEATKKLKESADFIIADVGQLMYNWKNIEIQESR